MTGAAPLELLRVRLEMDGAAEQRETSRPAVLHIENNGPAPLRITHVAPILPDGVTLLAVAGNSYLRREQTYRDLCGELRLLIQDEYFFASPDLIDARRRQIVQLINEAIVSAPGNGLISRVFRVWRFLLSPVLAFAAIRRWHERFNANQLVIDDYEDARKAWEMVRVLPVPEAEKDARNRDLITLKLEQLEEISEQRRAQVFGGEGWLVDAYTAHSEALILRCAKSAFAVRHYPIVIEVTAVPVDGGAAVTKREGASVRIPPKDLPIAALAMACAPVGHLARIVVQNRPAGMAALMARADVPRLLLASVLAFVLSLAFERINWARSAQLSLTWRTAILLGFGAGAGTDNLLRAIQAFFGVT